MFASAGILWGVVTLFHGLREWRHRRAGPPISATIAVGAGLAITCLGYLVYQF